MLASDVELVCGFPPVRAGKLAHGETVGNRGRRVGRATAWRGMAGFPAPRWGAKYDWLLYIPRLRRGPESERPAEAFTGRRAQR